MSLSDRIIVMQQGRIVQDGTPYDVYDRPTNPFVADFVGASNLMTAQSCTVRGGDIEAVIGQGLVVTVPRGAGQMASGPVTLSIRPERVELSAGKGRAGRNEFDVIVQSSSYQGARHVHVFKLGQHLLRAETAAPLSSANIRVRLPASALQLYAAS